MLNPEAHGSTTTIQALLERGYLVRSPDDGRLWHIAHAPLKWRSGVPAKSAWSAKQIELLYKTLGYFVENDRRVAGIQFQGVVCSEFGRVSIPASTPGLFMDCCWVYDFSQKGNSFNDVMMRNAFIGKLGSSPGRHILAAADLSGSIVVGATDANLHKFGMVRIRGCRFLGPINFHGSTIDFSFDASGAEFFEACDASGIVCGAASTFDEVKFHNSTDFSRSLFSGNLSFRRAIFFSDANFIPSKFEKRASFQGSIFEGRAIFGGTVAEGPIEFAATNFKSELHFEDAEFEDYAEFNAITWPKNPHDYCGAFRNARFSSLCLFDGSGFGPFSAFDKTQFQQSASLDSVPEAKAVTSFRAELHALQASQESGGESGPYKSDSAKSLSALEGGCRSLKAAMAQRADRAREHLLYRFELLARNAQSKTPWQEKWASYIYEEVSDYGTSITRPVLWLIYFWAFMSLVYLGIGVHFGDSSLRSIQTLWDAFDLSLSRVFQPLTSWSASNLQDNALGLELIGQKDRGLIAFFVRFLGALQSLISIILLFLSGLALRRRFQIN
jgi:hypothetical protein